MKRKAFILTEILTGMLLQVMFAITLCGAFYLILTFSTSTQQILAAHDQGQMVISYIDNRIRNAGVGLHNCGTPAGVADAFKINDASDSNMEALRDGNKKPLPLPVAITSKIGTGKEIISSDDKVYEGNILVLLHAHKDNKYQAETGEELIFFSGATYPDPPITVNSTRQDFKFLANVKNSDTNFNFYWPTTGEDDRYRDIKYWAVAETSGVPFRVSRTNTQNNTRKFSINAPFTPATIYPMSELLNLECQKLYVMGDAPDSGSRSFVFSSLYSSGTKWETPLYHTKGILELYMTLDTKANPPIFDLKVLVSEGKNSSSEITERPSNWPAAYWQDGFAQHRVHVSQASWKLYNLAPLYHHD